MNIDIALLGVLISLILAVLVSGVFIGRLSEKVRGNRIDINENKDEAKDEANVYRKENREEHKAIADRLDKLIMNGGGKT